jgi:hypothetical protein
MSVHRVHFRLAILFAVLLALVPLCHAQFSSSVQGTVTDTAGRLSVELM